jgi:hypothetical protein
MGDKIPIYFYKYSDLISEIDFIQHNSFLKRLSNLI